MHRLLPLLALTLALSGCSGLSTAVVPAEEPSVTHTAPDTIELQELPPVKLDGEASMPLDVTTYADTSSRPAADVEAVEVDRSDPDEQTVTVRSRRDSSTIETTFRLPVIGERTVLFADSAGLSGTVFGAPVEHRTDVITSTIERPWHAKTWTQIRLVFAFVGGIVFGVIVAKLTPL